MKEYETITTLIANTTPHVSCCLNSEVHLLDVDKFHNVSFVQIMGKTLLTCKFCFSIPTLSKFSKTLQCSYLNNSIFQNLAQQLSNCHSCPTSEDEDLGSWHTTMLIEWHAKHFNVLEGILTEFTTICLCKDFRIIYSF